MSEHLSLLVLIVALATGMVTSLVMTSYMQSRQPEFFRYFLTNILLFNLLILSGLVFRYLQLSLQTSGMRPYVLVLPVLMALMAVLKFAWLYAFIIMNKTLPADVPQKQLSVMLIKAGVVVFASYTGLMIAAWVMSLDGLQQLGIIGLEVIIIGGALMATFQLMLTGFRLSKDRRRKSILVFAGYHLLLLGIIFLVMVMGWLQSGPQRLSQLLANGGFLILYNVFPLVWIRCFRPLRPVSDSEKFELFGITRREKEIIRLIQDGKTNQEIADSLYISVATVKDHNHNIFKKCGTRNRLELAKLFQ